MTASAMNANKGRDMPTAELQKVRKIPLGKPNEWLALRIRNDNTVTGAKYHDEDKRGQVREQTTRGAGTLEDALEAVLRDTRHNYRRMCDYIRSTGWGSCLN